MKDNKGIRQQIVESRPEDYIPMDSITKEQIDSVLMDIMENNETLIEKLSKYQVLYNHYMWKLWGLIEKQKK